jgi:hypothetical protein
MKYIQPLIILALILYIMFLQQCNTVETCNNTVERDTVTVVDTVHFQVDKPFIVEVPVPYPVTDTFYLEGKPILANFYTQEYEDSLLVGDMSAVVEGRLLEWQFTYTPKFPKYINTTTTITNTVTENKNMLFMGLETMYVNNTFINTNFKLSLYQKKGYLYSLGYDPLNRGVALGMHLKIQ